MAKYLKLDGDDTIIEVGIEAIAKEYGWTETVLDEQGQEIPNPKTAEQKAVWAIKQFLRDTVTSYNIKQAQEAAIRAATQQSEAALDALTLTLEDM